MQLIKLWEWNTFKIQMMNLNVLLGASGSWDLAEKSVWTLG